MTSRARLPAPVLLLIASALHAETQEASLFADTGEDAVRLVWEVRTWPEDVTGFVVRRRQAGGGAWEDVTGGPVVPGFQKSKDLSNVEPDAAARTRITEAIARRLREGTLRDASRDEFLAAVRKPPDGFFVGLRYELFTDAAFAPAFGLGCIDRKVRAGQRYEYGLFPVLAGGRVGDVAATCTNLVLAEDGERLRAKDLAVARGATAVSLSWRLPVEMADRFGVSGFHVYRATKDAADERLLMRDPVFPAGSADGWRSWAYVDKSADPAREYEYAVAPVNLFGREIPLRTTRDAPPAGKEAEEGAGTGFKGLAVELAAGGVAVTWEFAEQPGMTGFRVERTTLGKDDGPKLSDLLPPDARRHLDDSLLEDGRVYLYRVRAVAAEDLPIAISPAKALVFFRIETPPAPSGLRAEWIATEGKRYLLLRWDPRGEGDRLTRSYVLYADHPTPGEVVPQASVPRIEGNEFYFEVANLEGRSYTVGIAAVGDAGQESARVETKVYAPGQVIAAVTDLAVERTTDGKEALVRWEHAAGPELRGFRIWVNGEAGDNETRLGSDAREWRFSPLEEGTVYRFEVRALSLRGKLSSPATVTLSTVPGPAKTRASKPADLRAKWDGGPDPKTITLKWNAAAASVPVDRYLLAVDDDAILVFGEPRPIEVKKPGEFPYQPPRTDRSYSFRLWAVAGQERSVFAEALALAGKRTLPPAVLEPRPDTVRGDTEIRVQWRWDYPEIAGLLGFRLYRGVELVADENELGPKARKWMSEPIKSLKKQTFAIEAVAENGEVSERGPARVYLRPQR